jgi:arabinofuranan 3-O-arabinosyltransferase
VPVRVIGVGVVALLAVAVAAGFLIRHWSRPAPGDQAGTAKASMARVAPGSVRASASSSIPHDPRYAVSKTLDGDPATAWNSNGARIPSNVGVRLTYTFDRPVRLARITVINGYAHTPTDYRNNQRVKRCTVLTDAGSRDWSLADTAAPQRLDADLGPTGAVTLVVKEVYPGTVYPDLAVSEVSFDERR